MGAKIKQVPISFGLRNRGTSKQEVANFFDSLMTVLAIRLQKNKEFVKFGLVGATGFVTDSGIFNVLSLDATVPRVAAIISGFVAMTVTFVLNNTWSFRERKKTDKLDVAGNLLFYFGVSVVPIIFRSKLVEWFDIWFGHNFWIYNSAFLIGVGLGLVWNFFIYSKVIWRKQKAQVQV